MCIRQLLILADLVKLASYLEDFPEGMVLGV